MRWISARSVIRTLEATGLEAVSTATVVFSFIIFHSPGCALGGREFADLLVGDMAALEGCQERSGQRAQASGPG
jgi:hypothetical protein